MKFDLMTERWIPVVTVANEHRLVSLRELFLTADSLREVMHHNPLVIASVYRLCLAILFRVWGSTSRKLFKKRFLKKGFSDDVFAYLDGEHCCNCFDLFSATKPFFQIPGFAKDKIGSVKKLSPQFATANNKTLFSHLQDKDDFSLEPGDAALNILVFQYFSLGGGNSGSSEQYGKHPNFANSPLVGGSVIYIQGQNLYQTLLLNLFEKNKHNFENNKPVWELPPPTDLKPQTMQGISHYLTWPSRFVRLLVDNNGLVTGMYFAQGLTTPKEVPIEPYFTYQVRKDGKGHVPLRLSFDRAFWRDSSAILGFGMTKDDREFKETFAVGIESLKIHSSTLAEYGVKQVGCQLIAMDNNKANPLAWFNENIPIYFAYVQQTQEIEHGGRSYYMQVLDSAIKYAEFVSSNLNAACRVFASNLMMEGSRNEDISRLVLSINSGLYYWPNLDEPFQHLYRDLAREGFSESHEVEELKDNWSKQVRKLARQAFKASIEPMNNGSARAFKAYGLAYKRLEKELLGDQAMKWIENRELDDTTNEVVKLLYKFQQNKEQYRSATAQLKRCVSDVPTEYAKAYRHLEGIIYEETDEWNINVYCWCSGLFAINQNQDYEAAGLGNSLHKLRQKPGIGESFNHRFELLLEGQVEQLPILLRSLFQMLAKHNIGVDYRYLIADLKQWQSPKKHTQLRWAREFWAPLGQTSKETEKVK